jgi:hypothetical protein
VDGESTSSGRVVHVELAPVDSASTIGDPFFGGVVVRFKDGVAAGLLLASALTLGGARSGNAQPEADDPDLAAQPDEEGGFAPSIDIHGFVSQGAFLSTENDYIGRSERGSVEFFEAALNASSQLTDRLRAGVQLFTRDLGPIGNYALQLDWGYLDYRWRDWLGMRAGRIKLPYGLYNEFGDVDAARLPILLPQGIYPLRNRDILLAHTGVSIYGERSLGRAGAIDYQLLAGTIFVDRNSRALVITGPFELEEVDNKYVAGGQVFWRLPISGLRLGASYLHTDFKFHIRTDPLTASQLIAAELVPPDFDGTFVLGQRDVDLAIGSIEYIRGDLLVSGEYSRWWYRNSSTIPLAVPESDEDNERFYGMLAYRLTRRFEAGAYYSFLFVDADDRDGSRFPESHRAYQKDLAVTLRLDVNDFWLWKLEAHYIDGTAELIDDDPMDPGNLAEHWGLYLVKTTVTF